MGIEVGIDKISLSKKVRKGALLNQFILNWWNNIKADGGTVQKVSDVNSYSNMARANGMWDSIKFGMLGGYNLRTDGSTKYVTKGYSLDSVPNDATQTTESNQPFLTGNIAPNEKWGLKNPNGGSRYLTHPEISFAADEPWSVTTVFYLNGNDVIAGGLYSRLFDSPNFIVGLLSNNPTPTIGIYAYSGAYYNLHPSSSFFLGKNTTLTLVKNIDGITTYIDGINLGTKSFAKAVSFLNIFSSITIGGINGTISSHIIHSEALTPTQVLNEATFLRTLYPEIESVEIGTQRWATSNCEMVATPMGNVIANVTDNATWADSQNIYDTTYAATVGTADEKEQAALEAAAMWCYYNNDPSLGAIYGKLYNWYAVKLLQNDIDAYNLANPSTPWGWHVPSEAEFDTLATTLGGASVAGGKMKVAGTDYWDSPNTGANNSSGFSSIPGGYRLDSGAFGMMLAAALYYAITEEGSNAYRLYHRYDSAGITNINATSKSRGNSIRLIKD